MFEPRLGRERSGPGLASLPGPCYVYVMHLHWLTVRSESKGRVVQHPLSGIQS